MAITMREINKLSVPEKIILAEKIWDSLPQNSDELSVSSSDMKVLDQRIDQVESGKVKTIKWTDLKKKLKAKKP